MTHTQQMVQPVQRRRGPAIALHRGLLRLRTDMHVVRRRLPECCSPRCPPERDFMKKTKVLATLTHVPVPGRAPRRAAVPPGLSHWLAEDSYQPKSGGEDAHGMARGTTRCRG